MTKTKAIWADEQATVAIKVLNLVKRTGVEADEVDVAFYCNGREGGFRIDAIVSDVKSDELLVNTVVFTQGRNCDDIVVYFGTDNNFDLDDNVPDEETFRAGRYFRYGREAAAARFIVKHLSRNASKRS